MPEGSIASGELKPPLAIMIEIMRAQSDNHSRLSHILDSELTIEQKTEMKETTIRVRNIKVLIQDIIKQFDMIFGEVMASNKKTSGSVAFGEISPGAVKSLTDLLYLSHIDKKLLQTLGEFFYRMSDSLLMSKTTSTDREQETLE